MTVSELCVMNNRRGMADLLTILGGDPVAQAANALLSDTRPIVVCTGFPVSGRPETDGPPGAIAIVDALEKLGRPVRLATSRDTLEIIKRVRPRYEFIEISENPSAAPERLCDVALVTIEICGRCSDGTYRNMRGVDISNVAPKFELTFGCQSLISIGDGGNEFGMGSAGPKFFEAYKSVSPPTSNAEHLIPASVSNYGGYALVCEMQKQTGQNLLPNPARHVLLIEELVSFGMVDGFSGLMENLVDGESLNSTLRFLSSLHAATGSEPSGCSQF
ncbi:MAG: glutamate cyclase domain-containing protein [Hyphomicrobiaceae bacterium]